MSKPDRGLHRSLSPAAQDYLKVIFKLGAAGEEPTTSAVAQRLGVTPGTVTTMLQRLSRVGLVTYSRYQAVQLTEAGRKVALELLRHHRLLELYLHRAMGY